MGQGSGVAVSCGVGRRSHSDPVLLWLGCKPAAVAPIQPLAWEPPCATGVALNKQTRNHENDKLEESKEVGGSSTAIEGKLKGMKLETAPEFVH